MTIYHLSDILLCNIYYSKHPNKKGGNLILFLKRNIHISALVVKKTKFPQLFQCLHSTLLTNQLQDRQRLHQPQTV